MTTCPQCRDSNGLVPVPESSPVRYHRCPSCLSQARSDAAGIPVEYRGCDFDSFLTYNDGLQDVVDVLQGFAAGAFPRPAGAPGLLLMGRAGAGKTHLACATMRQIMRRAPWARCCYHDTKTLLHQIKRSFNPETRKMDNINVLQRAMEDDLLLLDDLGAERLTDWVGETMDLIIFTRYNERLSTIFTSNLADDNGLDSLQARVGFRAYSRLQQMCEIVTFPGVDARAALRENGSLDMDDLRRRWWKLANQKPTKARRWG